MRKVRVSPAVLSGIYNNNWNCKMHQRKTRQNKSHEATAKKCQHHWQNPLMRKERKVQQRAKQVTFEDVTDEVKALLGLKSRYRLLLADVCIQKRHAKVLNPGTCGLGLCWNRGLCRHNQIKISSQWSKVDPNPMSGGQRGKLRHRRIPERQPCKGRGGDWSYPVSGQRAPRTADNFQMTGERHEQILL